MSADFPDREVVFDTLKRGAAKEPDDTVFLIRGKPNAKDAARWAVEALKDAGREPVLAETNRSFWGPRAGSWRDGEMLLLCDMLVVFHDKKSATTQHFIDRSGGRQVHVIERGAPRKKYQRRARKPIGA